MGPCLCGDLACPSCGHDFRCVVCGQWFSDGCEHLDENGDVLPEFAAEAASIEAGQQEAEAWEAKFIEEQDQD